ncbi:nuclear transcription factor Y subunit B-3-like [Magnolia sinica]|uniref:nuclear transcription factor Y subunit B-3-like n=1 Tax=Magnolia sinica TaxID=86752 RepID=UPI00265B16A6|nr:nuclear transcription factor Y subunit B-3-like [Magnolia sinica]
MTGRRHQISPVGTPPSDNESGAIAGTGADASTKEQDRFLPIANVSRIMKKSLPANAKISKEAKETVQECVSEFISFITGEASDKCQREKRKTINGDDLLWAMTTLGFENYVGPLKVYLNKYRETEGEKNSMARQGDQSPKEESNNNTNHAVNPITNHSTNNVGLSTFNSGFYSVVPQNFGGEGGRVMSYGGNSKTGGFHMGGMSENGDGNGVRSIANHHHGIQWQ